MSNDQAVAFKVIDTFTRSVFGMGSAIVGGYARDILYGVKPNDMDIGCCLGSRDPAEAYGAAERLVEVLRPFVKEISISQAYDQASSDFNDRLHILIQATLLSGEEIDILWYKDCSWHGVFEHYDSNVNKCLMDGQGNPFYWDSLELPTELVTCKPLTELRIKRLSEIADKLGIPFNSDNAERAPVKVVDPFDVYDDSPF